jgi:hypothetical protein
MSDRQQDFVARFRPVGNDRRGLAEFKRILKSLLRGDRLRCVETIEVPQDAPRLRRFL